MKKILKRLATGFLAFATIVTALPTTAVHASEKQYWTESAERVGIVEKVMNDGSIGSTFNEGYMKVEGETAYCVDITGASLSRAPLSNSSTAFFLLIRSSSRASSAELVMPSLFSSAIVGLHVFVK